MSIVSSSDNSSSLTVEETLDNQIRVATPENISFHYEVTGPFRRLLAYVADIMITVSAFAILTTLIWTVLGLVAFIFRFTIFGNALDLLINASSGLVLAAGFILLWFYGAFMETNFNGQTFGKMLARIRTISVDGSSIDASQAALRNFFRLLDVSPFVPLSLIMGPFVEDDLSLPIFAFGFICMAISPRYQRVGDLVAGTMVVTEEPKWAYGLAKFTDSRVPELAEAIDKSFVVTPSMARTLAEYVDRRRVLPMPRATEIAKHMATPLIRTLGLREDTSADLLLCALYYRTYLEAEEGELMAQVEVLATKNHDGADNSPPGGEA